MEEILIGQRSHKACTSWIQRLALRINGFIVTIGKQEKKISATIKGEPIPTLIIPVKCKNHNLFAISFYTKVKIVRWDGVSDEAKVVRTEFQVARNKPNSTDRFAHGQADKKGRFYGGLYPIDACVNFNQFSTGFHKYSKKKRVKLLMKSAKVSTGFTFNYKNNELYWTDACRDVIEEAKWSWKTGRICKVFFCIHFSLKCF